MPWLGYRLRLAKAIESSYATGSITGRRDVGGLAGSAGSIRSSFSAGPVRERHDVDRPTLDNIGGLVGRSYDVSGSYWDVEASGVDEFAVFDYELGEWVVFDARRDAGGSADDSTDILGQNMVLTPTFARVKLLNAPFVVYAPETGWRIER